MKKIRLCDRSHAKTDSNNRLVTWVNGQAVTVERVRGAAPWNKNDREEDLFISFAGTQRIQFRDRWLNLEEGEAVIIPRGVEYRPVTNEDIQILSF